MRHECTHADSIQLVTVLYLEPPMWETLAFVGRVCATSATKYRQFPREATLRTSSGISRGAIRGTLGSRISPWG